MTSVLPHEIEFAPFSWGCRLTSLSQVEYLVVTYSEDDARVRLSLRQADILKALENEKEVAEQSASVEGQQQNGNGRLLVVESL